MQTRAGANGRQAILSHSLFETKETPDRLKPIEVGSITGLPQHGRAIPRLHSLFINQTTSKEMESDLIQELLSRHQNKPQPESVALTSVLTAIRDVVEDQGLNVSPVSLFVAAVASLSATDAQANAQVLI